MIQNKKNKTISKTCCLFNFAPHYRSSIFQFLEKQIGVDFYFGKTIDGNIKPIDFALLKNIQGGLYLIKIGPLLYYKNYLKVIKSDKYDSFLVTGEPRNLSLWIALLYCKFFSKKQVYLWTHGWYGDEKGLKKYVKRLFFKLSTHVFVYGNYAKEMMEVEGVKSDKITSIFNSLDYDTQLAYRKECKKDPLLYENIFNNKNKTICYIGRIQRIKKIEQIFKAISILKDKSTFVNLMVIGDGDYMTSLKKEACELDIESQVYFYGACYDESIISNYIFNSCLVVSPGNIGLTAIHALSYGAPALTHSDFQNQMPEFESIVSNLTGEFYEKDNIQDLADKIKKWTSDEYAIYKRSEVRDNCYRMIDEIYNPYNQIKIFKEYFEK